MGKLITLRKTIFIAYNLPFKIGSNNALAHLMPYNIGQAIANWVKKVNVSAT